jgi:SAM-dependent methyltransferase
MQQWNHWLNQFLGASVLDVEQKLLSQSLATRYGNYALLMGVPYQAVLLKPSLMLNNISISPLINKNKSIPQIESDFYELPIIPGSIDLVILPHLLEFVDNPQKLLAEACRLVKPEGNIIIFGFNPLSLWGLKKYLVKNKNIPWMANFIRANLIKKWLKLADFELMEQNMLLFRPPLPHPRLYQKLKCLEWLGNKLYTPLGGIYALTAKAKVIPLTPIKLHWKQTLSPLPVLLPRPLLRDVK